VFVSFSAGAVQCAPGHWTLGGLYSWSGYLFTQNVGDFVPKFIGD